ncbi:SPOR domain-containing protein [Terrihalobacillus insolitus]|uniref:SPOR domain-containing protein n=1 Tax=Terrihalobacillus insolitus TaxID=2950438 RepID=UPI00234016FB|nr:SPOR domain-containing protein [Terrihalobacillus insolitus]
MGKSKAVVEQMVAYVEKHNPKARNIERIAKAFIEIGAKYGVRGDMAFCQSILETGWFGFKGSSVSPDQNNFCGMGAVGNGVKGNSFDTIEEGVRAQIQHLLAYATKNSLPKGEKLVDPRFKYVTRGIAPHWEDLDNRWAMRDGYGKDIVRLYNGLLKTPIPKRKLYRVQIGAFSKKKNAEELAAKAKKKGFDVFIKDGRLYYVQIGAFGVKKNAEELATKAKRAGFDVFIKYE